MSRMRMIGLAAAVALSAACSDGPAIADIPWRTVADSTGDTIRISITGPMPASGLHALVSELRVGAEEGAEEEIFGAVTDVIGTDDGGVLVWDSQAKAIRRYGADGKFVRRYGARGGGPGEHGQINGIARLPSGGWAVWDADGSRINRYAEDGTFVDMVRSPITGWYLTDGLRADHEGRLYVWAALARDTMTLNVTSAGYLILNTAGEIVDTLVTPMWGPEPEALSGQSPDGGSMMNLGRPWVAGNEAAVLPDGGMVAGLGNQYVFYILPRSGKPTRIEREYDPVPVSALERREREAQILERFRRLNPSWTWTGAPIPQYKPPYKDIRAGLDGRIWISLFSPAEPIPAAEMPPVNPQAPNAVRLTTREPELFDVYEYDGTLLGRVAVPPRTRILRVQGNNVWGVQQDSLDVNYAVRFRIEPALPRPSRPFVP